MMNTYKHAMLQLKAFYNVSYGNAANFYQSTRSDYYRGLMDGIDMCLDGLSTAIRVTDKEESNHDE